MRILLVNDDGFFAPGIRALQQVLQASHEVWVVAPDREVSAVGHAITLRQVIRCRQVDDRTYAVEGNPTDCVNLAVWHILPEPPDIIISGINEGWNLAEDITYSGTVAGAVEGTIHKIFSMAVSIAHESADPERLHRVAEWIREVLPHLLLARRAGVFLNINWPASWPPRGVRWTRLGTRLHPNRVIRRVDPRGRAYYWIARGEPEWEPGEEFDVHAVRSGMISITPVTIDWTDWQTFRECPIALEALNHSWDNAS